MLNKLKETSVSILPISVIVLVLNWTVAPLGSSMTLQFIVGSLFTILGLALFLLGADIGILPIGEKAGAALTSRRNLTLLLSSAFVIGFLITIAEPDVQVLAKQVCSVDESINSTVLLVMIAVGIGLFTSIGLLRTVLHIPLKYLLIAFYVIVFAAAFAAPGKYLAVAFDSGGATTGHMTVPFILALGVGVAAVQGRGKGKTGNESSFGVTGMASIGPILAVLILGICAGGQHSSQRAVTAQPEAVVVADVSENADGTAVEIAGSAQGAEKGSFAHLLPETLVDVAKALLPLVVLFVVFQFTLLHLPPHAIMRMSVGLVYSFVGLVLFMLGVNGGFMPAGDIIGYTVAQTDYRYILVAIGVFLGAVVVCAEPAVWVLTRQVEEISGGTIKRSVIIIALSAGVAVSVGLSILRVLSGFSLWFVLLPGYAVALLLTFFCPQLFTAIAFDSGGVASGPMTTTFILSFMLGISNALGGNPLTDAFGVIALVAMAPLITIQVLGILYAGKTNKAAGSEKGGAK
ncbi:MAG: DUF1538 domain-containing protein [Spirochaetaceae bacterium]|nr:DUF1538 domain-containing protein [Spirochaetaceae bacterium]